MWRLSEAPRQSIRQAVCKNALKRRRAEYTLRITIRDC